MTKKEKKSALNEQRPVGHMCEECPNSLYSNKTICKNFPENNREQYRSTNFALTKSFAFDIGKVLLK